MDSRFLLLPALLLASLVTRLEAANIPETGSFDWRNPPQGLFSEQWFEFHMNGNKAGYTQITQTRKGSEIRTRARTVMRILRIDISFDMKVTETYRETVDGRPLGFDITEAMSGAPVTTTRGTFEGRTGSIVKTMSGNRHESTVEIPEDAVMMWGLELRMRENGIEPGTRYSSTFYAPSMHTASAVPVEHEIRGSRIIDYRGTKVEAIENGYTMDLGSMKIPIRSWMTKDFVFIDQTVDMIGMKIRTVLVDQATALADYTPPELFLSSMVELDGELPEGARSARYRIRPRQGDPATISFPDSESQTVSREEGAVLVTVRSPDRSGAGTPLDEEERRKALTPNLYITSDHQAVRDLLSRAELPEDAAGRIRALRRLVHDHVVEKNLSVAFAPAHEVALRAEGDCSEHAVLLAALGRADGIPSRVAIGLMYLTRHQGEHGVMGYHMWNQFHLEGRWIDFDASVPGDAIGPERLAFGYSYLDEDSLTEFGLGILDKFDNLEIELDTAE